MKVLPIESGLSAAVRREVELAERVSRDANVVQVGAEENAKGCRYQRCHMNAGRADGCASLIATPVLWPTLPGKCRGLQLPLPLPWLLAAQYAFRCISTVRAAWSRWLRRHSS